MKTAMPSPNGTNHAGLYLKGSTVAAYDSALTDADGRPLADSAAAHRVLLACADKIDMADLDLLLDALQGADLLSESEAAAIKESLNMASGGSEMAGDSAVMQRRRALYADGRITGEMLRAPVVAPMSSAAKAAMVKRFPNSNRLKK